MYHIARRKTSPAARAASAPKVEQRRPDAARAAETFAPGDTVSHKTFGTGTVSDLALEEAVEQTFDLRPAAIIRDLDLRRPIYRQLAAYGHFGRTDLDLPWERTDRVEALKANL